MKKYTLVEILTEVIGDGKKKSKRKDKRAGKKKGSGRKKRGRDKKATLTDTQKGG